MFNFFSRQNIESNITSFYTVLSQDERVTYAVCKAVDLCKAINVDVSLLNRTLDIEHKDNLLNELNNNHHFMGSIKLVHEHNSLSDKYRIIDGQHRYISLYEYINRNKEYDCDIKLLLEIYEVDDINGEYARELFRMANTVKNIDYTNEVSSVTSKNNNYEDILIKLMALYPNTIKDNTRVQYPNISARDLKEQLRDKKILEKYDSDEVIKQIITINNELASRDMRYFFGEDYRESRQYDRYLNAFIRAKNNKCFLGILKTGKIYNFVNEI